MQCQTNKVAIGDARWNGTQPRPGCRKRQRGHQSLPSNNELPGFRVGSSANPIRGVERDRRTGGLQISHLAGVEVQRASCASETSPPFSDLPPPQIPPVRQHPTR